MRPSEAEALMSTKKAKDGKQTGEKIQNLQKNETHMSDCFLAGGAILDVERDAMVRAQGFRVGKAYARGGDGVTAQGGQHGAYNWGLDRVDQRRLPLDGISPANTINRDRNASGSGTFLYVVDSGVMAAHGDFSSVDIGDGGEGNTRVVMRDDFLSAESREDRARTTAMGGDCYGHGTAVASLAAGRYSGLAPGANIGSVRVLDCEGNGRISVGGGCNLKP